MAASLISLCSTTYNLLSELLSDRPCPVLTYFSYKSSDFPPRKRLRLLVSQLIIKSTFILQVPLHKRIVSRGWSLSLSGHPLSPTRALNRVQHRNDFANTTIDVQHRRSVQVRSNRLLGSSRSDGGADALAVVLSQHPRFWYFELRVLQSDGCSTGTACLPSTGSCNVRANAVVCVVS